VVCFFFFFFFFFFAEHQQFIKITVQTTYVKHECSGAKEVNVLDKVLISLDHQNFHAS